MEAHYYLVSIDSSKKNKSALVYTKYVLNDYVKSAFNSNLQAGARAEMRVADFVNYELVKNKFDQTGITYCVVNDIPSLLDFKSRGGIAFLEKNIAANYTPYLIASHIVKLFDSVLDDAKGYKTAMKRFAKHNYKTKIKNRDGNKCKLCFADPLANKHVDLEVHHIIPWSKGGLTNEENLITLCKVCHRGINSVPQEDLFKLNESPYYFEESEINKKVNIHKKSNDDIGLSELDFQRMFFVNYLKDNCIHLKEDGNLKFFRV